MAFYDVSQMMAKIDRNILKRYEEIRRITGWGTKFPVGWEQLGLTISFRAADISDYLRQEFYENIINAYDAHNLIVKYFMKHSKQANKWGEVGYRYFEILDKAEKWAGIKCGKKNLKMPEGVDLSDRD